MLEFNTNIEEVISAQTRVAKEKAFITLGAKKQVMESEMLTDVQKEYINRLRSTYAFDLHKDGRYIVITMYYSATKKYDFIIVDLETLRCATAPSIKIAKEEVMKLVDGGSSTEETEPNETPENFAADTPEPSAEEANVTEEVAPAPSEEAPAAEETNIEETSEEAHKKPVSKKNNRK